MKKLLLIFFGIFLLAFSLSGCSNNNIPLHTINYYMKHTKQRTLMIKECNKSNVTPQVLMGYQLSGRINSNTASNLVKDCFNAFTAQQNAETQYRIPPPPPSSLNLY